MLVLFTLAACKKKEGEIISDTLEPEYMLPQGNHPYDARIVNFYNTYGCYILYKFSAKDFAWNINSNLGFVADQGDEAYIEPALEALDKYLLELYPDDFLKKALPYKIILSSLIRELSVAGQPMPTPVNSVSSVSQFTFGHASSRLATLTPAQLKVMKAELHTEFWRQATAYGKIPLPPLFVNATDYTTVIFQARKNAGVFQLKPNVKATAHTDFVLFINAIATSTRQQLEQSLFLPANDPNGKYKLKYNFIINYYKENYNVDLETLAQNN